VYALKEDRKKKFYLALRVSLPVIILTGLLAFVVFEERRSFWYDLFILLAGIFASVYFIFFMIFSELREKIIDETTSTFNRKYLTTFLQRYIKPGKSVLVLISLDNIKEINERYGIENGDRVLKDFAKLLDRFFSKHFGQVPIGRLQAGDFVLVIDDEEERVKEALERFMKEYDNAFLNNIEIKLFASYLKVPSKIESLQSLFDQLYEEIYYCKGKCKTRSKESEIYRKRRENSKEFERQIAQSIQERRISLLFQPTLNLHTRRFDMAEILVKLLDSEGHLIHPSQFVPIVNRLGLENEFDLSLTEELLRQITQKDLPLSLLYSFNLSPYSVRNRRFTQNFFALFERFAISPSHMVIELFEMGIYKDVGYYKKVLDIYKERGFHIAFDNFGSCNASVEYIKSIEADFIHFDKFFTKHLNNPRYKALLAHWIELFRKLNVKSVVKFIDKEELIPIIEQMGADYIQGYAIAKPMDGENLKNFVGESYALR